MSSVRAEMLGGFVDGSVFFSSYFLDAIGPIKAWVLRDSLVQVCKFCGISSDLIQRFTDGFVYVACSENMLGVSPDCLS